MKFRVIALNLFGANAICPCRYSCWATDGSNLWWNATKLIKLGEREEAATYQRVPGLRGTGSRFMAAISSPSQDGALWIQVWVLQLSDRLLIWCNIRKQDSTQPFEWHPWFWTNTVMLVSAQALGYSTVLNNFLNQSRLVKSKSAKSFRSATVFFFQILSVQVKYFAESAFRLLSPVVDHWFTLR